MQSNQELSMSMFATKEDYETAAAELRNAGSEKVVLDIKANPELVLQLKEGDQVSVDGVILDVLSMPYRCPQGQYIYFRTVDSRPEVYNEASKEEDFGGEYSDYIKHLRKAESGRYGKACMTREEMKALLESGNYCIG